jgi:hypothetical protein
MHPVHMLSRRGALRLTAAAGAAGALAAASGVRAASPPIAVEAFRRPGASDASAVAAAVAALVASGGGTLLFAPGRTYDLGRVDTPGFAIHLHHLRDARIEGNGATLTCETRGNGKTQMFLVQNCHGLTFANLNARDRGTDLRRDWKGMDFVHIESTAGPSSRIALENVSVTDAVSVLTCSGDVSSPRVQEITLRGVSAKRCYYGLNFQENGDDVSGDFTAANCRRAYFPYGVSGHNLQLDISHDGTTPGADACILIARKERDTQDIRVRARFTGALPWSNLVHLVQQPALLERSVIRDVAIDLFVDPAAEYRPNAATLGLTAYLGQAALPYTSDRWENITLSGCFGRMRGNPVAYHTRAPNAQLRVTPTC